MESRDLSCCRFCIKKLTRSIYCKETSISVVVSALYVLSVNLFSTAKATTNESELEGRNYFSITDKINTRHLTEEDSGALKVVQ